MPAFLIFNEIKYKEIGKTKSNLVHQPFLSLQTIKVWMLYLITIPSTKSQACLPASKNNVNSRES